MAALFSYIRMKKFQIKYFLLVANLGQAQSPDSIKYMDISIGCSASAKWKTLLPTQVRASVAHMDMAKDFDTVIKNADLVYNATNAAGPTTQVASVTDSAQKKPKT